LAKTGASDLPFVLPVIWADLIFYQSDAPDFPQNKIGFVCALSLFTLPGRQSSMGPGQAGSTLDGAASSP
jgi:hypothetical protein